MSERKIIEIKAAIEGIEQSVNRIAKGEDKVNWKQARVDASIAIAQGFASNNNIFGLCDEEFEEQETKQRLAKVAVSFADSLIAELQRVPTHETK